MNTIRCAECQRALSSEHDLHKKEAADQYGNRIIVGVCFSCHISKKPKTPPLYYGYDTWDYWL